MKKRFTVHASSRISQGRSTQPFKHKVMASQSEEASLQKMLAMIPDMQSMLNNILNYLDELQASGSDNPAYYRMIDTLAERLDKIQSYVGPANFALGYAQSKRGITSSRAINASQSDDTLQALIEKVSYIQSLLDSILTQLNTLARDFGSDPSDYRTVTQIFDLLNKAHSCIGPTNYMVEYEQHKSRPVTSTHKISGRYVAASQAWDTPEFDRMVGQYMPSTGEGDTMASQCATAINKLIYKWYNDGDVFDNHYALEGFANDLSSFANWLYKYVPSSRDALDQIYDCNSESDYERLLHCLVDYCCDDEDLEKLSQRPKQGSIYRCEGPFSYDDDPYGEADEEW